VKILVIGDSCIDIYEYGKCKRLNPEAPVPVFEPVFSRENGGMASNVAANLAALGNETTLITNPERVEKKRFVEQKTNYILLRVDKGDSDISRINLADIPDIGKYAAVVISDYDKGFLTRDDLRKLCSAHSLVFMDTKKKLDNWAQNCTFIKINETEHQNSADFIKGNIWLREKLITTLSDKGCRYKDKMFLVNKVAVKDLAGAGDTFLAGFVTEYLKTKNIEKAIVFANKCASAVVQMNGVSVIGQQDVKK